MDNEQLAIEVAQLRGMVATIGAVLCLLPEAAQIDEQTAIKIADTILGARAPVEASREIRNMLGLLSQFAKSEQSRHPTGT